jgi:NADP-dependent 3-hydroxy acid dehydrogenase YdfG
VTTAELGGQAVALTGGSAGAVLETGRRAGAEGADVMLAGRGPRRLEQAAADGGAPGTAALAVTGPAAAGRLCGGLPGAIGHALVTGSGASR